jgi:predicted lactoylglutathione lyase
MTKGIWLNLPVKDVKKSKEFFAQIGFSYNAQYTDGNDSLALQIGTKPDIVMLFEENRLREFIQHPLTDTKQSAEIIISFDAESREEVDEIAEKVRAAGGHIFSEPAEIQGWMYGFAFTDLDGHRWNALYMDTAKMKGQ